MQEGMNVASLFFGCGERYLFPAPQLHTPRTLQLGRTGSPQPSQKLTFNCGKMCYIVAQLMLNVARNRVSFRNPVSHQAWGVS